MNEQYEQLKYELPSISEVVKLFPDSVQIKVFDLLVGQFLGKQIAASSDGAEGDKTHLELPSASWEGIALLDEKGEFHLQVRDVKASSQIDATKRLTYVTIRAFMALKGEKVSRRRLITPILEKWRAYGGKPRDFLANDVGIIRDGDLYSLDVHAMSEADEFIRQIKDSSVQGSWKPSAGTSRRRGKVEKNEDEEE